MQKKPSTPKKKTKSLAKKHTLKTLERRQTQNLFLNKKTKLPAKQAKPLATKKKHKTHCQKKQTEKTMLEKKLSQNNRKKKAKPLAKPLAKKTGKKKKPCEK